MHRQRRHPRSVNVHDRPAMPAFREVEIARSSGTPESPGHTGREALATDAVQQAILAWKRRNKLISHA